MSVGRDASSGVAWPTAEQFNEAIQNLSTSMADEELRGGTAAVNTMGMPLLYSGGFADVYQVHCPGSNHTWAVKCFTKGASGLRERYRKISNALDSKSLPFTVDFEYLEKGVLVRGDWFPIVKMKWVEGQTLNEFVAQSLDKPNMLDQLFKLWVKLAARLHQENIAHADLQHGNVILVPKDDQGRLLLKLIDYDGMWTEKLAGSPSGELGHANYQHPQRKAGQIYSLDVDRFSHLVICCALRCLYVGGKYLWTPFDNGENLLFVENDFHSAAGSRLFRKLWTLRDQNARALVGHLILATKTSLDQVPHLHELVDDQSQVRGLTQAQENEVRSILNDRVGVVTPGANDPDEFVIEVLPEDGVEVLDGIEVIGEVTDPLDSIFGAELPDRDNAHNSNTNWKTKDATGAGIPVPDDQSGGWRAVLSWTSKHPWQMTGAVAAPVCSFALIAVVATSYFSGDGESSDPGPSVAMVAPTPREETETASVPEAKLQKDIRSQPQTNSIGMQLRLIPAGTSNIPSPRTSKRDLLEVQIVSDFYIAVHELTQAQYREVTGKSPSHFQGDDLPVEQVSALEADEFCRLLTGKERLANRLPQGMEYRLPTQAEWAYAALAGQTGNRSDDSSQLEPFAWTKTNSEGKSHPVAGKEANQWSLFDMLGNVDEWLLDEPFGDRELNPTELEVDPLSHGYGGSSRLCVGGDWDTDPNLVTLRGDEHDVAERSKTIGFRVVLAETPTDILALRLNKSLALKGGESASDLLARIEDRRPADQRIPIWRSRIDDLSGKSRGPNEIVTNSIGMILLRIAAGEFEMGSDEGPSDQRPRHRVRISQDFYLAMHEVTQEEYELVMNDNPSQVRGPQLPVEQVRHEQASEFCRILTDKERREGRLQDGLVYRLPTEAEWEFAARAGTTTKWFLGDDEIGESVRLFVWSRDNTTIKPRSVEHTVPNPWGFFDIAGNVNEWVLDGYASDSYPSRSQDLVIDPLADGAEKVVRGGSIADHRDLCSSASRAKGVDKGYNGFRVALAAPVDGLRMNPVEKLVLDLEDAIDNKDATTATALLAKIELSNPSEARLSSWKANVAKLTKPAPPKLMRPGRTITNSIGMKLVQIRPGEFEMGSNTGVNNEQPIHRVRITREFYLGIHEITQAQYRAVTGQNPSRFQGDDLPVETVSAEDADEFCRLLTEREQTAGRLPEGIHYRLPTEAQWEFAARAGTTTQWYCGDADDGLDEFAWYAKNSMEKTHSVGKKKPNACGLYDVFGNVFEWTSDKYLPDIYQHRSQTEVIDPVVTDSGDQRRIDRGGSWYRTERYCRSANRNGRAPTLKRSDLGFRVALVDMRQK